MEVPAFLVWFGIFALLAVLATAPVHFHLAAMRRAQAAAGSTARATEAPKSMKPCPQCGESTASDAAFCEKCGVPMMLWQLKLSREVDGSKPLPKASSHPVPIIVQDLCIGCSACVNACAENVLEIVAGKSTVVNLGACTGASTCAEVCPTGACQLTGGGAARRVEVPQIGPNFETNQPGVYAIGELGGMGLIKNAVNEGRLVVDGFRHNHVSEEGILDLIVIGAGPAGLSAALSAKECGLKAVVLEQGTFADTIRRFPNKKIVMAEPVRVPMYGSLWISDAPKETLLSVWKTIIDSAALDLHENEQVKSVTNHDGYLFAHTDKGVYQAQKIVLAIGKRGTPRQLEVEGAHLAKVMYSLTDAAQYKNSNILVVGGGDSAAEAAIGLSHQEGNQVFLSYRKASFSRMKEKNLHALTQRIKGGHIKFLAESEVTKVFEGGVELATKEGPRTLSNDHIFAVIGGTSPNAFLEKIGVHIVTKEVSLESEQKIPA